MISHSDDADDFREDDYWDDEPDPDFYDEEGDPLPECGMDAGGNCSLAGSEECDECPAMIARDKLCAQIKKAKA